MISLSEVKESIKYMGIPSTIMVGVLIAFHTGFIPSDTSRAYDTAKLLSTEVTSQQQMVKLIVQQHGEQMDLLMQGMREICFNTAKTQERERACANLQHSLSARP